MNNDPAKDYNEMGEAYIRKSEKSIYNAFYDRPAIISLISDIKDKQVLEVGCAGGILTELLINQGANVIAIDISESMITHAKKRLGTKANFFVADVTQPLDFIKTSSVDTIIASLVLHYISNWFPVFEEFSRILKVDGAIVISIHHPHADWKWHNRSNYFKKELYEEFWTHGTIQHKVEYYHRTLASMFAIFRKYGFYVDVLLEPLPIPAAKEVSPKDYDRLCSNPHFLFLRLKKLVRE